MDFNDIITNVDDSLFVVMSGGAVRFTKGWTTALCSLFVYSASNKTISTCVGCLVIGPQCRTPCLIDWGARWRAEPSSSHHVVWALRRQRCRLAAVCQAEVAGLYTCQHSRRIWWRGTVWPCCLGIMAQVAPRSHLQHLTQSGGAHITHCHFTVHIPSFYSSNVEMFKSLYSYLVLISGLISHSLWLF